MIILHRRTGEKPPTGPRQNTVATDSLAQYGADGMTALDSFAFVRHVDGLRHQFERDGERHGRPAYCRTDGQVWCVWGPDDGWHCEIADGLVTACPLNSDGDEHEPPATVWRSFKGDRSHLYDLRPLGPEG
ncbi:hypothetical protein [Streptomyces sp. NPDC058773]|uniref:hypothetical protein n=1 Tax=Streptomyces sp. NPDC058773 TaxID=3346632 RepID=UPI0036950F0E